MDLRLKTIRSGWTVILPLVALLAAVPVLAGVPAAPGSATDIPALDQATASSLARLALGCLRQEYPNKLDHVMSDAGEVQAPRRLHPAFYGCFDWHSAVHGHWLLVTLLQRFPDLESAAEIRRALDENLSEANLAAEAAYLRQSDSKSFERTYGWAWLLKLAEALHGWDDPDGRRWSAHLQPLAEAFAGRYLDFLPRQTYPIRTGVHPNTAFGLAFALDWARAVGQAPLERLILERARSYYLLDRECPSGWEPGGEDFFSPCLMEADLMRRVLPAPEFTPWLKAFLPGLGRDKGESRFVPAVVADRTDPKIVHLDGLNLSRAWCLYGIAAALPRGSAQRQDLVRLGDTHAQAALAHVASGNYEGEHWLASFALLALGARQDVAGSPQKDH